METKEIMKVEDELNLYLVQNQIKPSSLIFLTPIGPGIAKHILYEESSTDGSLYTRHSFNDKAKEEIKALFDDANVPYDSDLQYQQQETLRGGIRGLHEIEHLMYQVGKDKESLEKLLNASTHNETGLALGFPQEAVDSFLQNKDGVVRNGSYVMVMLSMAEQHGMEIPSWLSYLSHVPEQLDIVNGRVSESSEKQGREYQEFVRTNNPELASRIEDKYKEIWLPKEWTLSDQGVYYPLDN